MLRRLLLVVLMVAAVVALMAAGVTVWEIVGGAIAIGLALTLPGLLFAGRKSSVDKEAGINT